jgi:hypothetical protein
MLRHPPPIRTHHYTAPHIYDSSITASESHLVPGVLTRKCKTHSPNRLWRSCKTASRHDFLQRLVASSLLEVSRDVALAPLY